MMGEYKTIQYKGDIGKLAKPENFEKVKKAFLDTHRHNLDVYAERLQKHKDLIRLAELVYGRATPEVRYLIRHEPKPHSINYQKQFQKLTEKLEQWHEEEKQREKRRDYYQRHKTRLAECTRILEANGFVAGQDFNPSTSHRELEQLCIEAEPGVWRRKEAPIIEEGR